MTRDHRYLGIVVTEDLGYLGTDVTRDSRISLERYDRDPEAS